MSQLTTPLQTLRDQIYNVLSTAITDVQVLKAMPTAGAPVPSIVLTVVAGSELPVGIGEAYSSTQKGLWVRGVFQVDVWASSWEKRDELADKVLKAIFEGKHTLLNNNVFDIVCRAIRDLPTGELGEKIYRKTLDFEALTAITKAA
jgi:hypothetical protein